MKKNDYLQMDSCRELCKALKSVSNRHAVYQVFEDWLALSAIAISNAVDLIHYDEREKQYLNIVKNYTKDELQNHVNCLSLLIRMIEDNINEPKFVDLLGNTFHGLNLHDKYHGQFFTPNHICEFIGEICLTDKINNDIVSKALDSNGYISLCEPCCGSAGMILGFAEAMNLNKLNPQKQLIVTATDIDLKCVHMTYLQLALYGIPAIVIHGNSLTNEVWSVWYTPLYVLGGWDQKLEANSTNPNNLIELANGQITFV